LFPLCFAVDIPVPPLVSGADCHFLALAPHTVTATKANLQRMRINAPVSLFVPIFPIGLDCSDEERAGKPDCDDSERKGFVLQGLFQTHRQVAVLRAGLLQLSRHIADLVLGCSRRTGKRLGLALVIIHGSRNDQLHAGCSKAIMRGLGPPCLSKAVCCLPRCNMG
ncbi:hypothetical protein MMC29_004819, partial [Sticta canariensis]|nr:hypothetical protein [Sticta canariensis]